VTEDLSDDKSKALSTSAVGDWIVKYIEMANSTIR
jgi:hypothetical protein